VVEVHLCWGEERVSFRGVDGNLVLLPLRWTSLHGDPLLSLSAGRSLLRVDDLLRLVGLIVEVEGSLRDEAGDSESVRGNMPDV